MGTFRAVARGMAVVTVCAAAASGFPSQTGGEEDPLEHFQNALQAYVALHDLVEQTVTPLEISPDAGEIQLAVDEMAAAMRAARPSAREGDIFDAEAAAVLRRRIRESLREPGCGVADILAAERDEGRAPPSRPLVHDQFDWGSGSFMPGCVLDVLPRLPDGLQFRFVERDLVFLDVDADLVVDVLPDALPAGESWKGVRYARDEGGNSFAAAGNLSRRRSHGSVRACDSPQKDRGTAVAQPAAL